MRHIIGAPEDRFSILLEQLQRDPRMSMHKGISDQVLQRPAHRLLICPDKEMAAAEIHLRLDPPVLEFIVK